IFLTLGRTFMASSDSHATRAMRRVQYRDAVDAWGSPGSSLVTVSDPASARVVRRDLDGHAVARENLDVVLPHAPADGGEDGEAVVGRDAEHRVRQCLLHDAVELELVGFGLTGPLIAL